MLAATGGMLAAVAVFAIRSRSGRRQEQRPKGQRRRLLRRHSLAAGGKQFAAGNSNDKLFGPGAVTYVNKVAPTPSGTIKVTTKPVVLFYKDGTLTGTATSELTVATGGSATLTDGKIKAAHGTGAQAGHSFVGTFTGVGNATTNLYKITYKGTYK